MRELGADDYIVKPFSPTELVARIRAALCRHREPDVFVLGDLAIEYERRAVTVGGEAVDLTAKEYELPRLLSVSEGGESADGGEESGKQYGLGETYNTVRNGARLALRYDAASRTFRGTVTNESNAPLTQVRVEVHLIGDVELGPTKPMDLAPGQTIMVSLDATGRNFSRWSPHAEVGPPSSLVDPTGTSIFAPSLGGWAVIGGVDLGIEHKGHGLSARHEWQDGVWTSSLSPDPAPQHQPTGTGTATWTGKWVGYHASDPAVRNGAASVTVNLDTAPSPEADLTLGNVPVLGTLQ